MGEEILKALQEQNNGHKPEWLLERIKEATDAFKKNRPRPRFLFDCSAALRPAPLGKGRVLYSVTGCEATYSRYSTAKNRGEECTYSLTNCATYKRLGKRKRLDIKPPSGTARRGLTRNRGASR